MLNGEKITDIARKKLYLNTHLLITDNNLIEIENCKKVVEYNDIYLKILTSNMILEVLGSELSISDYNTDGIIIRGKISSVEFMKR